MKIEIRGLPVHYDVIGAGRPMLMLHGGGLDNRHMIAEMEPIFRRHPDWMRIYPDLPGGGKTPAPDWIVSQGDVLDLVLDFIDAVFPGQRFAIAGTSRGGYLARGVVYRRAADIDGALLVTPASANAGATPPPPHVTLVEDPQLVSELKPSETGHFGFVVVQERAVLEKLRALYYPAQALRDEALRARIVANYDLPFDVNALPQPFDKPVLIVCGTQDDMTGFRDAWKLMDIFPRATYAVLDRSGHLVNLEHPGLFEALAEDWLQRVEENLSLRRTPS